MKSEGKPVKFSIGNSQASPGKNGVCKGKFATFENAEFDPIVQNDRLEEKTMIPNFPKEGA